MFVFSHAVSITNVQLLQKKFCSHCKSKRTAATSNKKTTWKCVNLRRQILAETLNEIIEHERNNSNRHTNQTSSTGSKGYDGFSKTLKSPMENLNETQRLYPGKGSTDLQAFQLENRPWLESFKGILAAFMQMVSYVVSLTSVQLLDRRIPDMELQACRCSAVLIACIVWMLVKQKLPTVPVHDIPAMLLYRFLVTFGATVSYVGFTLVPPSAGQCLSNTSNLLSGLLIFWVCGQEKCGLKKVLCVTLCIVGDTLVTQPWHTALQGQTMKNITGDCSSHLEKMCSSSAEDIANSLLQCCETLTPFRLNKSNPCELLKGDLATATFANMSHCSERLYFWFKKIDASLKQVQSNMKETNGNKIKLFGLPFPPTYSTLLGLFLTGVAGMCFSLQAAVQIKNACLGENVMRSLFWSFLFGFISSLVFSFVAEFPLWPEGWFDSTAVLFHCLSSVTMWVFWMYSLRYISGSALNVIHCTAVVFMLIPQYTILASILPGHKNWLEVAGVIIVLSGSVWASVLEMFPSSDTDGHWVQVAMLPPPDEGCMWSQYGLDGSKESEACGSCNINLNHKTHRTKTLSVKWCIQKYWTC